MIEDDNQFLEVTALGSELAWRVMKLWMKSAGRTLNNYQESLYSREATGLINGKHINELW